MNIQEYISSGILEQYLLGELNEQEAAQVARIVASHPELRKELDELEKSLLNYAAQDAPELSPSVKDKIMSELPEGKTITLPPAAPKMSSLYWFAVAASAVAICTTSLAIYFYTQWRDAEGKVIALEQNATQMADQYKVANFKTQEQLALQQQYLNTLLDSGTVKVPLKGLEIAPEARVEIYWQPSTAVAYLNVVSLPPAPAGKQYQLWAIKDGVPIDMGTLNKTTPGTLQLMKNISGAQAFAITLEKTGGNPAPTLEAMYVMGTI